MEWRWCSSLIAPLGKHKQAEFCEFGASTVYISKSSRPDKTGLRRWGTVLKKGGGRWGITKELYCFIHPIPPASIMEVSVIQSKKKKINFTNLQLVHASWGLKVSASSSHLKRWKDRRHKWLRCGLTVSTTPKKANLVSGAAVSQENHQKQCHSRQVQLNQVAGFLHKGVDFWRQSDSLKN